MSGGAYYVRVPYGNVATMAYGNSGRPDRVTVATEPGMLAGPFDVIQFSRGRIEDAITAWRNGQTYDAIHPLADRGGIIRSDRPGTQANSCDLPRTRPLPVRSLKAVMASGRHGSHRRRDRYAVQRQQRLQFPDPLLRTGEAAPEPAQAVPHGGDLRDRHQAAAG